MIASYPSPAGGEEYAVSFDRNRAERLLVLPALFDEANKLRHFTVEVMRELDRAGYDTFLPDLAGCNESLAALEEQSFATWRSCAQAAAVHFCATAVLSLRAGTLCEPEALPAIRYAPLAGPAVLRSLIRARVIASREAGRAESSEALLGTGRSQGLELAGYRLSAAMIGDLASDAPSAAPLIAEIDQSDLGGAGLWLRAEPSHDPAQAAMLATFVHGALA